jgi:hypothetical protein
MKEERNISENSIKILEGFIDKKGLLFEDKMEDVLTNLFNTEIWNVSKHLCLRDVPIHEGFNERYEIDFLIRRMWPFFLRREDPMALRSLDYILDPHLLIEAKSCSYDWCFFQHKKLHEDERYYGLKCSDNEASFSTMHRWNKEGDINGLLKAQKVKRSVLLRFEDTEVVMNNKKDIQTTDKDLVRDSVRQIAKNTQVYLQSLENESPTSSIFPIIVTNAKLKCFDHHEFKSGIYHELDYVCFEFDEFMFWKGEKILTKLEGSKDLKPVSKFHVFIVNSAHIETFLHQILPNQVIHS